MAGHIPGALNRPFSENLTADGFKPAAKVGKPGSSTPYWANAPRWSTTAARVSAQCPTCWLWRLRAWGALPCLPELERVVQTLRARLPAKTNRARVALQSASVRHR